MDKETSFLAQSLRALGHEVDESLDFLKNQLRTRFKPRAPLEIIAYRGFGNRLKSTLTGRVLAHRKPLNQDLETRWNNLLQSYRRFETDEVPNIMVEASVAGNTYTTVSDAEGYFCFEFATPNTENATTFNVTLGLPERASDFSSTDATIYIPPSNAKFGVISDIDDTILKTNATSILQMMRLTLLESSRTRLAFTGVSDFYHGLHQDKNPFFYVSSSPWNLYEFLVDFMKLNKLVDGPLLLRDFGIDQTKFIAGSHLEHKLAQIRNILTAYPNLPFILVGDSGQDDPEIYATIAQEFPGQINTCYIRDVSNTVRDRSVQGLINTLSKQGVDMLLVPDTFAAAVHANSRAWLSPASLNAVRLAVDTDRQSTS